MANYLISISTNGTQSDGTIHDSSSKLKVKAFDLLKKKFTPSKGEKRFFVTAAGEKKIAFETKGYNKHRELLILQMISWYCVYLGLIEAQIHPTWPV
jgi:hypothetical protein